LPSRALYATIPIHVHYTRSLKKRGFDKLQAVCTVMRKPLHAIYTMLKSRTPFDSRRFYTPTETASD